MAVNPIPITADCPERIIDSRGVTFWKFNLLQDWIWLSAGKCVAGKNQQRNTIGGGSAAGGNHVERAGSDRGHTGDDLTPIFLLCIADSDVRHTLFVVPLIKPQLVPALL